MKLGHDGFNDFPLFEEADDPWIFITGHSHSHPLFTPGFGETLKESPQKQGKALSGDLGRYRSLHTAGRYRVVYEVKANEVTVIVVAAGIRKEGSRIDVYETLKKMLRSKLFECLGMSTEN